MDEDEPAAKVGALFVSVSFGTLPVWHPRRFLLRQDASCHLSSWLQAADAIFRLLRWECRGCPAEQPLAMRQLCRCGTLAVGFEGLPPAESHYTSLRVASSPGACPDTDSVSPALKQQRTPPGDPGLSQRHICAAQTAAQTPL